MPARADAALRQEEHHDRHGHRHQGGRLDERRLRRVERVVLLDRDRQGLELGLLEVDQRSVEVIPLVDERQDSDGDESRRRRKSLAPATWFAEQCSPVRADVTFIDLNPQEQIVVVTGGAANSYASAPDPRQGQVAGWVEPQYLSPLTTKFVDGLKRNAARLDP